MPLHVEATVYGRAALSKIAGGARGGTAQCKRIVASVSEVSAPEAEGNRA